MRHLCQEVNCWDKFLNRRVQEGYVPYDKRLSGFLPILLSTHCKVCLCLLNKCYQRFNLDFDSDVCHCFWIRGVLLSAFGVRNTIKPFGNIHMRILCGLDRITYLGRSSKFIS